jgi:pimeloyl-ACP methyl ester carboxylesterase
MAKLRALLLPGINGESIFYNALIKRLSSFAECTGAALPKEGAQDYSVLIEWLANSYSPEEFDVVIAESFSGPLSVLAVANRTLRPRALVLGATFNSSPFRRFPVRPFAMLASTAGANSVLTKMYIQHILLNAPDGPSVDEVWTNTAALDPKLIQKRIEVATHVDVRAEYAGLSLPILVLNGRKDRLIFAMDRGSFAANDNAEVIWLDAPHFLFQCAADDAARSIRHFLTDKGLLAA